MKKREFFLAFAGLALSSLQPAHGSDARMLGVLLGGTEASAAPVLGHILDELRKLGWKEGQNLRTQVRYGGDRREQFAEQARALVKLNPTVILAPPAPAVLALKSIEHSVPVVFWNIPDPVKYGLVHSLARPGGNFTGVSSQALDVAPKLMELARSVAPQARRIGGVINPSNPSISLALKQVKDAAAAQGLEYLAFEVSNGDGIESAFRAMLSAKVDVLHVAYDRALGVHYGRIAERAAQAKLPSVSLAPDWAERGGLLRYGPDWRDSVPLVARYVDRILRGAHPSALPVEQPTKFSLVVNMKTARGIGLTVPQSLLVRADRIIE